MFDVKMYSESDVVEILERLESKGFDLDATVLNDLTIEQLDKLGRGITN